MVVVVAVSTPFAFMLIAATHVADVVLSRTQVSLTEAVSPETTVLVSMSKVEAPSVIVTVEPVNCDHDLG